MLHMFTAISDDFDAPGKTQLGSSVFCKESFDDKYDDHLCNDERSGMGFFHIVN